jgi:hypothetical protein
MQRECARHLVGDRVKPMAPHARLTRRRRLAIVAAITATLLVAWFALDRPGRFGPSCFGYTSYGALPRPVVDFDVRADRALRYVAKTHDVGLAEIQWLLDPPPDVLIICEGWQRRVQVRDDVRRLEGVRVEILPTGAAQRLFNRLRRQGRRVAIHVHSTC